MPSKKRSMRFSRLRRKKPLLKRKNRKSRVPIQVSNNQWPRVKSRPKKVRFISFNLRKNNFGWPKSKKGIRLEEITKEANIRFSTKESKIWSSNWPKKLIQNSPVKNMEFRKKISKDGSWMVRKGKREPVGRHRTPRWNLNFYQRYRNTIQYIRKFQIILGWKKWQ